MRFFCFVAAIRFYNRGIHLPTATKDLKYNLIMMVKISRTLKGPGSKFIGLLNRTKEVGASGLHAGGGTRVTSKMCNNFWQVIKFGAVKR